MAARRPSLLSRFFGDIGRILTPADKIDKEKAVTQENGQEGEDPDSGLYEDEDEEEEVIQSPASPTKEKSAKYTFHRARLLSMFMNRPSKEDLESRKILRTEREASHQSLPSMSELLARRDTSRPILKPTSPQPKLDDCHILKGCGPYFLQGRGSVDHSRPYVSRPSIVSDDELQTGRSRYDDAPGRAIHFKEDVEVHLTYRKSEYRRGMDDEVTYKRLTPTLKNIIRDELNEYKMYEMPIHESSVANTALHF